jgi:hypothetical protein
MMTNHAASLDKWRFLSSEEFYKTSFCFAMALLFIP